MPAGAFQRVTPIGDAFIRGPARLLVAPITQAYPANIGQVINLPGGSTTASPAGTAWTPTAEVQTLTITGAPIGGTFTLSFFSVQTLPIPYNATAAQVVASLSAIAGIGSGGITGTGGPLPTTPVVLTFAGNNAPGAQPLILAQSTGLTGGTTPAATMARTTLGVGVFDPVTGWTEVGSTRGGVQIGRNNTETLIDIDQIYADITALPDNWEMTIATNLAETTFELIQLAWEGGAILTDTTQSPNERHLPMGQPLSYVERRLAIVHQKVLGTSKDRVRMHAFRRTTRSPQNSTLDYAKAGNQQTLAHTWRAFGDQQVADPYARFGDVFESLPF